MVDSRDARSGYTLAEAMMALVLAGALTACLAALLGVVGRLAATQARLTATSETERIVAAVLGAELRTLTASDYAFLDDSVRLRAFRGAGAVCAADGSTLTLAYRGVRLPEPDKDSVLLIWPSVEAVADIIEAMGGGAGCEREGTTAIRIAIPEPVADSAGGPAYALIFETGAYSIAGSALRYRRGAGGRQPVTEANLVTPGSRLARGPAGGTGVRVVATLQPAGWGEADAATWTTHMPQGAVWPAVIE